MIVRDALEVDGRPPSEAEAGFTLLEVIVALAILALSLGVIFHTIATTVGRTGQADTITQARLLAQSLLVRVGKENSASVGETAGEEGGGLRWRVRQKLYGQADDRAGWPVQVIEVFAEVSWGQGTSTKSIAISTLRMASRQEPR